MSPERVDTVTVPPLRAAMRRPTASTIAAAPLADSGNTEGQDQVEQFPAEAALFVKFYRFAAALNDLDELACRHLVCYVDHHHQRAHPTTSLAVTDPQW